MRIVTTASIMLAAAAALSLSNSAFGQTGACCRDLFGTCDTGIAAADCMGVGDRFIAGGTCDDFSPPCGIGRCCTTTGCVESTRVECIVNPDGFYWRPGQFCDGLDCTDCDGNFQPDALEIAADASLDCNANGVLDRCEIDAGSTAPGGPYFCTTGDCAMDCNNNGIPDECEIYEFTSAPGGPYFCTTGCDPDCNNNGIPDACDVDPTDPDGDGSVSDDILAPIGVPDECRRWTGAVNDLWSEPGNWLPPTVPNNTMTEQYSVVIDGSIDAPSANVEADEDVTISSLVLRDNSVLTLSLGDLTLDGIDGMVNEGLLLIPDGRGFRAATSFTIRGDGGLIRLAGESAQIASITPGAIISNEIEIQGRGMISANLRNAVMGTISANDAGPANSGTLLIAGPTTLNNGNLVARLRATLLIATDISEELGGMSSILADGANVTVGDGGDGGDDPDSVDGCGPIFLKPTDLTTFKLDRGRLLNFTLWEIGDDSFTLPNQRAVFNVLNGSTGVVAGPVNVRRNGTLTIDNSQVAAQTFVLDNGATFGATAGAALTARGRFVIGGSDETLFDFAPGTSLAFEGGTTACGNTPWDRTLEAASRNFGAATGGGGYDNNFDFAELKIAANGVLQLVDEFDNGNRPLDGFEAVYCDTLVLETGATLFLNGISLFAGGQQISAGPFGGGQVVDRQACCLPDSRCVMEIADCCAVMGGDALGDGSQCNSGGGSACPPLGACCLADQTCVIVTPAVCISRSGEYRGDATTCASVDCSEPQPSPLPQGACCISDGSCNLTTEADCTDGGASYFGDDSTCGNVDCSLPAPGPVAAPLGACCLANLTCMDLSSADCTAMNGEYLGSNSNCGIVDCANIDSAPAADVTSGSPLLDEALCRFFRQTLCGIPGCAPCGAVSLMLTFAGIRRMRRRRRRR
ncbi:MAG: hypothetical protein H6819_10215 [Phycisphaerales bacterium]|nr:hypothetical protein [Phycisphaerales bacterium]MCB9856589.1 hypothetical protein [Phycisphaerales bacterium]MCB9864614.1 hypothetical protein [Phycisphaerales bacterium]